jgi:hypothetical protein
MCMAAFRKPTWQNGTAPSLFFGLGALLIAGTVALESRPAFVRLRQRRQWQLVGLVTVVWMFTAVALVLAFAMI